MWVRDCFGPRPGFVWYLYDYKQVEARVFADVAGEETMLAAFSGERDVYVELADAILGTTLVQVSRQQAKTIFLGTLYGMGRRRLGTQLETGPDEANKILNGFAKTFPEVSKFTRATINQVSRDGYVTNKHGRKILVPREVAYKGVNYTIQSDAADLMKRAMIRVHRYLLDACPRAGLVMTIHDELVVEFPGHGVRRGVFKTVRQLIEDNGGVFGVSTPVDVAKVARGKSWLEAKEVKDVSVNP